LVEGRFFSRETEAMVLTVLERWRLVLRAHGEAEGIKEKILELDCLKARFSMSLQPSKG
jgi:hypothetical protein